MAAELPVDEQIKQLDQAKAVVAQDPAHYPDIVDGILPIAQKQNISLRRWCSSFFIDAFTSFALSEERKQSMAVKCMDTILILLHDEDYEVQKNAITISATVYGLAFQFVAKDDTQSEVWNQLMAIKNRVLEMWDSKHFGVEAESIKFAQQVIIFQSPLHRDPRLANNNDTFSLSSVPSNHALIHSSLEAEAQGLLDRLLGVFLDNEINGKSVTATIYAISTLMKLRPATIPKCMNALLAFDPSQKTIHGTSAKEIEIENKVIQKGLTIIMKHVKNANMAPNFNSRIQTYLTYLGKPREKNVDNRQTRPPAPRQDTPAPPPAYPPNKSTAVPPGPYSYASLYSLLETGNPLLEFDAQTLPPDMAVNIALAGIASSNPELMKNCINIVKTKYQNFLQQANSAASINQNRVPQDPRSSGAGHYNSNPLALGRLDAAMNDGDDSDYDPNEASGQQVLDPRGATDGYDYGDDEDMDDLQLGSSFSLPPPTKLNDEERLKAIKGIVSRMISYDKVTTTLQALPSGAANANRGIDRVAITEWTRNTWVILASRLLTRGVAAPTDLQQDNGNSKVAGEMADSIRESLFVYAIENFRERLDIIIEWLNEEWFGEFVQSKKRIKQSSENGEEEKPKVVTISTPDSVYFKYTARVLDNITPFLTKGDRPQFLRLLSDLPELNQSLIQKLKSLCIDPERRDLGMGSLL